MRHRPRKGKTVKKAEGGREVYWGKSEEEGERVRRRVREAREEIECEREKAREREDRKFGRDE